MPIANVGSRWVSGALEFFDHATKTIIATVNPTTLKFEATRGIVETIEAGSTAANLVNYGLSTITIASTSAGVLAFTLVAPIAGVIKYVASLTASTGGTSTVAAGTGVTFDSTGATLTFSSQGMVQLVGASTAKWLLGNMSTGNITLA